MMTTLMQPIRFSAIVVAATLAMGGTRAFATHKSWVLKNSGANCRFAEYQPGESVANNVDLENTRSSATARTAVCPITLASRWGGRNPTTGATISTPVTWAAVRSAKIVVSKPTNAALACGVSARKTNGTLFFSRRVSTTGTGTQELQIIQRVNGVNKWGPFQPNDLDPEKASSFEAMFFECTVPSVPGTKIHFYHINLCHNTTMECTGDGEGTSSTPNVSNCTLDTSWSQSSGIECMPTSATDQSMLRHTGGISNFGDGNKSVFCPITPPPDDSWRSGHTANDAES
jgi:hypothetical protein